VIDARKFSLLVSALVCINAATAQQNSGPTAVGFPEGGHFIGSEIESVQVNNGNLHVHLPLWSLPGRDVTPTAAYVYDSKGWYPSIVCGVGTCSYSVAPETGNTMQMSINASSATAVTTQLTLRQTCGDDGTTRYTLIGNETVREPDGTKHHLVPDPVTPMAHAQTCWQTTATKLYADDGSGWSSDRVSKTGGIPGEFDSNGNSVGTVDTMGRPYNPSSGSYYDSNGVLRNISVTTETVAISTHLCFPQGMNGNTCAEYTGSWTVPHIIALPNGLTYTIEYYQNQGGEIQSITFPSGAVVSYEYANPPNYDFGGRMVSKRTVTIGSQVSVWTYSYTTSGQITMIDPLSNKTVYTCSYFDSVYTNNVPDFPACHISKEQYYDSGSNLIKTIDIGYNGTAGAPLPTSRTTTWALTGQVSKEETDYETMNITLFPDGTQGPESAPITWGNVKEKREFDWGNGAPGSLLKRTTYTYLHTDTTVNPNVNRAQYLALNIADRPTSEIVRDGSGNIISQTKYYYDEGTLTSTSNVVQHDYTNYSASFTLRGNLTRVSRWLNTTGTWLDTVYTYDDLGNRKTSKDPNGHFTYYDYTDRFYGSSCNTTGQPTYALRTSVTDAKGYRVQNAYFQCTSQLQNQKDENDLQYGHSGTSYTYDLVNRLLTTTHSDGGVISTSYQDTVPLQYTTTSAVTGSSVPAGVTASLSHSVTAIMDTGGRVVQTQANNPEGVEYVDTTYDLLGRVHTVSNPHHANANPSLDGLTTYAYDALGRTTSVTHPDGSVLTTQYGGTAVKTTDEGNGTGSQTVQKINDYDGLGRLKSVCEVSSSTLSGSTGNTPVSCGQAISGLGFLTTYQYTYDSSGYSYSSVLQTGLQTRTFKYDSLPRLISTFNPEAGTTTYAYDNDGLLIQRKRPMANQTGSSVTTTSYTYDVIHRLLSESYDDGATPTTSYCYDETSVWGRALTNTYGRKTRALVGASCSTPSGTAYVAGESYSYDEAGRLKANDQCTPSTCGTSQKSFDYAYHDYLGGELTATDGVGNTYTMNPDSAGRLLTATSSLQDANHPATLFSNAAYGVFGLTSAQMGPSIQETITPQNRGWIQSIAYSKISSGTVYSVTVGHAPNGDVTGAQDTVNGNWTYAYDEFNRLTTASNGSISLGWDYDRFGNRWNQHVYAGSAVPTSNSFGGQNNRADGYLYDAAGNVLNDGINQYAYDAEGRIRCTVSVAGGGSCTATTGIHYAYDADGLRVARYSGATLTNQYLYNSGGQMVTELDGSGNWVRGEVIVRGTYVATYNNGTTKFAHADWLGTVRYRTNIDGSMAENCTNNPFGDGLTCNDGAGGPSNKHFTGKLHDWDSGLDYFGARYYASVQGRFLTPDWSATPEAVPYGNFEIPQSLNLYAYVKNNPITDVDVDGHEAPGPGQDGWTGPNGGGSDEGNAQHIKGGKGKKTAQQKNAPHPYVAPIGPGTEIGNILDPAHPSNPGPIGQGECVEACRHYEKGLPDHTQWTQGVPVVITIDGKLTINPAVKPGTAIAAGWDAKGHYPGPDNSHKNSGAFLGPALIGSAGSIRILDQWPGSPGPRPRDMNPTGGYGTWDVSNHSTAYYVIMAP
jgi:RHS repeat-associated protein